MIADLEFKQITEDDFSEGMDVLDECLGKGRVRKREDLKKIFDKSPRFFIGAFLDSKIVGIICGFYRENYLLLGELAVLDSFRGRQIGTNLVRKFLEYAKKDVRVGVSEDAMGFYQSLNFKPSLLIQFSSEDYNKKKFLEFEEIEFNRYGDRCGLMVQVDIISKEELKKLRKLYPKVAFQYIFIQCVDESEKVE